VCVEDRKDIIIWIQVAQLYENINSTTTPRPQHHDHNTHTHTTTTTTAWKHHEHKNSTTSTPRVHTHHVHENSMCTTTPRPQHHEDVTSTHTTSMRAARTHHEYKNSTQTPRIQEQHAHTNMCYAEPNPCPHNMATTTATATRSSTLTHPVTISPSRRLIVPDSAPISTHASPTADKGQGCNDEICFDWWCNNMLSILVEDILSSRSLKSGPSSHMKSAPLCHPKYRSRAPTNNKFAITNTKKLFWS